jgi:hypothetical protein
MNLPLRVSITRRRADFSYRMHSEPSDGYDGPQCPQHERPAFNFSLRGWAVPYGFFQSVNSCSDKETQNHRQSSLQCELSDCTRDRRPELGTAEGCVKGLLTYTMLVKSCTVRRTERQIRSFRAPNGMWAGVTSP